MTKEEENNITITMQDAREFTEFGMEGCVAGWRLFVESNGYNWKEVVLNGLTVKQLRDTDDAMALNLVNFILTRDS